MTARSHTRARRQLRRLSRRRLELKSPADPSSGWHPEPEGYRAWLADERRRAEAERNARATEGGGGFAELTSPTARRPPGGQPSPPAWRTTT